ncbi:MAG: hypothetical protein J6S85_12670 [Methanobrevibacter sp.]|nr:hypothetical protein [Methanobrevibacter sp.]
MKIIQKILWYFSPCRKCNEKDIKGLVACSCTRGIFTKRRLNRNDK